MAAGTTSVSPVGQSGSFNIFSYVGGQLMKASDRAARTRKDTDNRIAELEAKIKEDGEDANDADIDELDSLKAKRSEKGYFFKKALEFQATDKIKNTIGKFQKNPNLGFDPAASETERFKATANIMRPGSMPDTSDRQQPTDKVAMVGKGFKLVLSALEDLQSKVAQLVQSAKGRREAQKTTIEAIETLTESTKEQTETQKDLTKIQRSELDVQNATMDAYMDAQNDRERESEQAEVQAIEGEGAGNLNVKEVGQGAGYEEEVRDTNTDISGGNPLMRPSPEGNAAGITMGQRNVPNINQVSSNYGMQPPAPKPAWKPDAIMSSGGMTKPYQRQKLSNGGATFYNNPTNIKLSGGAMALPINRNTGREAIGGGAGFTKKTSDITKSTELFQRAGVGTAFATMAQLSDANPFMGPIMQTAIPSLQPIAKGYGFPPSMLSRLFKGGTATVATPAGTQTNPNSQTPSSPTNRPRPRRNPRARPPAGGGTSTVPPGSNTGKLVNKSKTDNTITFKWSEQGPDRTGEKGLDFSFNRWDSNYAVFAGEVIDVGNVPGTTYGMSVQIRSEDPLRPGEEFEGLYAHFDPNGVAVKKGDKVRAGQYLGKVGWDIQKGQPMRGAGTMTGPHTSLDFYSPNGGSWYPYSDDLVDYVIKLENKMPTQAPKPATPTPRSGSGGSSTLTPFQENYFKGYGNANVSVNRTTISPQSNMGIQLAVVLQPPRIIRPQKKAPATTPRSLDASAGAILDMNYGGVSV